MKRKKDSVDNNRTSGSKRKYVEFQEEISKSIALDDSIEPQISSNKIKSDKDLIQNQITAQDLNKNQITARDVIQQIHHFVQLQLRNQRRNRIPSQIRYW